MLSEEQIVLGSVGFGELVVIGSAGSESTLGDIDLSKPSGTNRLKRKWG